MSVLVLTRGGSEGGTRGKRGGDGRDGRGEEKGSRGKRGGEGRGWKRGGERKRMEEGRRRKKVDGRARGEVGFEEGKGRGKFVSPEHCIASAWVGDGKSLGLRSSSKESEFGVGRGRKEKEFGVEKKEQRERESLGLRRRSKERESLGLRGGGSVTICQKVYSWCHHASCQLPVPTIARAKADGRAYQIHLRVFAAGERKQGHESHVSSGAAVSDHMARRMYSGRKVDRPRDVLVLLTADPPRESLPPVCGREPTWLRRTKRRRKTGKKL
eukprot:1339843-Rhodomonas_salina.2